MATMSKDQERKDDQSNASSIVEKIQQLGQSNIPQVPDSNIHVLTIIGQIEGHIQLPPQNKTTKYEHLLPQLIAIDRKSTRLNSSHVAISYAVFCLKKKKQIN